MLSRDDRPGEVRFLCMACNGTFLSNDTLGSKHPKLLPQIHGARSAVPQEPLTCPSCAEPMRRLSIDTPDGPVMLDFCNRHGVWFDGTEIEQLLALAP